MAQPIRRLHRADTPSTVSLGNSIDGPLLPGEYRPLVPTPASSESGGAPPYTEKQLLRMLVEHYRWGYVAPDLLRRYNPHGRNILELVGGQDDA